MADSVVRLVVDSKEYDSKIQRATQGLIQYEKKCREVGGTLEFVEKEELDFVKALGQMETVSSSATGKLGELKKAFTELSVQYKNLTDAEKASPYGKALAESLDQLKGRIKSTEGDLKAATSQMSGAFDGLSKALGVNVGQLVGWGAAIGVAKGALEVAKDAFFASETNLDEWGRTVEASKSIYQSFLNSLNNGDISGFLDRISEIVFAARQAYDALDELGTYTAFNQRNVAKSRASYAKALDEYRLNPTAENKQTLAEANQQVMRDLQDSHDKTEDAYQAALRKLAEERLSSKDLQDAFVKMFSEGNYAELKTLKESYSTGTGLAAGQQYFNGMRTYGGRVDESGSGAWRDMTDIEKQQFEFARALSQVNDSQIKEVQALGAQSVAITEQIYQQDRAYNRLAGNNAPLRSGGGNGGGGGNEPSVTEGSIKAQEQEVARLTELWKNATAELRDGYKQQLDEAKVVLDQMVKGTANVPTEPQELNPSMPGRDMTAFEKLQQSVSTKLADSMQAVDMSSLTNLMAIAIQHGIDGLDPNFEELQYKIGEGLNISDETWQELVDTINEKLAEMQLDPIKLDVQTGELKKVGKTVKSNAQETAAAWQAAAAAVSNAGSALEAMEDPAAKVTGIVMQAVANIALGFAQATASQATGAAGVFGWIAAATAGLATMVATIATIKSVTKGYAQGGIVGGNSYSGDNMRGVLPDGSMVGLNSGEVVLNAAQQSTLAGKLNGAAAQTVYVEGVVSGKNLILAIQNEQSQSGVPSAKILAAH